MILSRLAVRSFWRSCRQQRRVWQDWQYRSYHRSPRLSQQHYHPHRQDHPHVYSNQGLPPVRLLRPTLWSLAAATTIYLAAATYEVHSDAEALKRRRIYSRDTSITFADLESSKANTHIRSLFTAPAPSYSLTLSDLTSPSALLTHWRALPATDKFTWSVIAANTGLWSASTLFPALGTSLAHVPALNSSTTLLTSTFAHAGILHLALNMYALHSFAPPVAASPTFQSSAPHLAAFYLSSGILASLAHHASTAWPRPLLRMVPGLGASGAIFALLGAFGMSYPDAQIGIILLPGGLPAQTALAGLAAFETWGLFIGWKRLPFAHAAHLAGLVLGAGYVVFEGRDVVWRRARKVAFEGLRALGRV